MIRDQSARIARASVGLFIVVMVMFWDRPFGPDELTIKAASSFYGGATMLSDGSIEVMVAFIDGEMIGETVLFYSKANPGYEKVRARFGLEHVGQSVSVVPWLEREDGGPPPDDAQLKRERMGEKTPGR